MELAQRNLLQILREYRHKALGPDLIAGIVVFLVAVPLCLGIAMASGAPLVSGLISGVIGGVVVGLFSSSSVSVSGPAAGMAAVVLGSIAQLGGFEPFLTALILAGIMQIVVGLFRAGFIADYVPSNVVQGLLCAIGILLILKQIPLAFTHSDSLQELKSHLLDSTESLSITPLLQFQEHINFGASLITILSLGLLIYSGRVQNGFFKSVPAPVLVVVMGIVLNEMFNYFDLSLSQDSPQLVNIPEINSLSQLSSSIPSPSLTAFSDPKVYFYGLLIAVVASLETLLNLKASEKLDPRKRHCDSNRELLAQGAGNLLAGTFGAIPITSVIVRTSVNIQAGARTKMATVWHGIMLLLATLLIPELLNKIPLSSLAAILLYTGYKLTNPVIYKNIFQQGLDRFIPFITTVIGIVLFNLLSGVLIGLAISLFYILRSNSRVRLDIIKENYPTGQVNRLLLPQQMTFLNKASLIAELESIPNNSSLIIDARYSQYLDKEIIEQLNTFKEEEAPERQISLNLVGFRDHYDIHDYIDFIQVTTYDVQTKLSPREVLTLLKEGNQRFLKDTRIRRSSQTDIKYTAKTQHPIAVVLGCIDSRVPVETIFDMGFGDLFCIRIAGNVVNNDILASMEYACKVIGAKLIVVLGHTRCGAISAAVDDVKSGHITELLTKIKPAVHAAKECCPHHEDAQSPQFLYEVTAFNISHTMQKVFSQSDILRDMVEQDEIGLVGAIYNVETGKVHFEDYSKKHAYIDHTALKELSQKEHLVLG